MKSTGLRILSPTMSTSFYSSDDESSLPAQCWPQAKNYNTLPSPKTLIKNSYLPMTAPAPLSQEILDSYEKGKAALLLAKEQHSLAKEVVEKIDIELTEAENALKKNRWAKGEAKLAYVERLKNDIQAANAKASDASDAIDKIKARYCLVNEIVSEHEKIVECYDRFLITHATYYKGSMTVD